MQLVSPPRACYMTTANQSSEIENDRLRHIRLHERVNDLPDPNYATFKYFIGHLHRHVDYSPSVICPVLIHFCVECHSVKWIT